MKIRLKALSFLLCWPFLIVAFLSLAALAAFQEEWFYGSFRTEVVGAWNALWGRK